MQLGSDLGGVKAVSGIMPRPILHEIYQILALAHRLENNLYNIQVAHLLCGRDVVDLALSARKRTASTARQWSMTYIQSLTFSPVP